MREFDVQHQIKLEQNYRSYSNILDSANHLIEPQQPPPGQNLRTDAGAGEPVRVRSATDLAEAHGMVDEQATGAGNDGFERKEIAVLYRSNAQSRVIESAAVQRRRAPTACMAACASSSAPKSSTRWPILRLLENPNDDTSFCAWSTFRRAASARARWNAAGRRAPDCGCPLHDAVSQRARQGRAPTWPSWPWSTCCASRPPANAARHHRADAGIQRPDRALPHRKGRRRPHRNLEELVNAAELCHAGRLWPRRRGPAAG